MPAVKSKRKRYQFNLHLPPALLAALSAHVEKTGVEASDFVRRAVAEKLGKPKLAEARAPGRPKKQA